MQSAINQLVNQSINHSINHLINHLCLYSPLHGVVAGITELKVKKFHAKIDYNNQPSLQLFQKKLHFVEVGSYTASFPSLPVSIFAKTEDLGTRLVGYSPCDAYSLVAGFSILHESRRGFFFTTVCYNIECESKNKKKGGWEGGRGRPKESTHQY